MLYENLNQEVLNIQKNFLSKNYENIFNMFHGLKKKLTTEESNIIFVFDDEEQKVNIDYKHLIFTSTEKRNMKFDIHMVDNTILVKFVYNSFEIFIDKDITLINGESIYLEEDANVCFYIPYFLEVLENLYKDGV